MYYSSKAKIKKFCVHITGWNICDVFFFFFGNGIYYFIVIDILFYCVKSYNKSTAAACE